METKTLRRSRKALSAALVAALIALTPGMGCYDALAEVVRSQGDAVQSPVQVPGQVGGVKTLPNVPVQLSLSARGLSVSQPALSQVPTVGAAAGLKAAVPVLAAPASAQKAAAAAPAAAEGQPAVTAQQVLQAGAGRLAKAPSDSERGSVLESIFTGAKRAGDAGALAAPELSASGPQASGLAPAVPVAPKSVSDLAAVANDSKLPYETRTEAVSAIAAVASDEAKASLKAIGRANPEGNAKDYEVKRKALQALAGLGEVVSLPPVSRAHADEILKNLAADKPQAAVFDYDGTLEGNQVRASAETAAALKASVDAGVETMILSARSDKAGDMSAATVLDSLSTLTSEQKQGLILGSNRGSRIMVFDQQGQAQLVYAAPVWTEAEKAALQSAVAEVQARYGSATWEGKTTDFHDYSLSLYLPAGLKKADVDAAAQMLREKLESAGVKADVDGRRAMNPRNPSYIAVNKFTKAEGLGLLRKNHDAYDRLRDVFQRLPGRLQGLGQKLVGLLPKSTVPEAKTLVVGDHFFDRTEDLDMAKAAPKGLALAVGGTADPRADRVFVWPSQGHAATQEILGALGRKTSSGVDGKSLFGIFASRTASISAFFLTSTAYAFIAIPAVGLASYGALMALGPLAAIALGPVSGLLAKKLSARNAMMLNGAFNVVLLMALPVMSFMGIVNFWTLLVASIANGYILSSTMTTEGIFIKRFSGKYLGTVNAGTMINYLSIQSVLGLILRAGRLTDWLQIHHPHLLAPYLIASAVNALVVLPLVWKFVSNVKATDSAPQQAAKPSQSWSEKLAKAKTFLKENWLEALVFGGGLALFPILHTTIPAVLGLLYWVSRTEGFKAVWANKPLRYSLVAAGALAIITYPIQSFGLPLIAEALAGKSGKSQLLGQLLGALFFGQLISSTSQAQLPSVRVPFIGKVGYQQMLQAGVLGLLGAWTFMTLAPGSILLTLAAAAVGAGLMALTSKLTDRGWIKYMGSGLLFLSLPLMFWGNVPALFASVLMMGVFLGPTYNAMATYFYRNIPAGQSEKTIAVRGSVFNGGISLGYALMGLMTTRLHMVMPGLLWPIFIAGMVAGLAFMFLPKLLPGLPAKTLKDKPTDK